MEQNKDEKQRVNLFLDPEIVKKAKIKAVTDNTTLSNVVENALQAYCKES